MRWHILASSHFDFGAIEDRVRADRSPRHFLPYLSTRINAPIHLPDSVEESNASPIVDRLASRLYSQAHLWTAARRVRKKLKSGDGVYAVGADAGLPLALLCAVLGPRPVNFAVAITDVQRPRVKVIGWLLGLLRTRWMIIVPHSDMVDVASRSFGRLTRGVTAINGLTDFEFFRPAEPGQGGTQNETRILASCGAEARDYRLLADATDSLNNDIPIDVKVCFASPNLSSKTRFTMPKPVPEHMEVRYYDFAELRSLYQSADAVVVPLLENRYAAGLSTVFEAVACRRPVVVGRSPGIVADLIDRDLVVGYQSGDVDDLQRAITAVLTDPTGSESRAERAHSYVKAKHSTDAYFRRVMSALEAAFGREGPKSVDDEQALDFNKKSERHSEPDPVSGSKPTSA